MVRWRWIKKIFNIAPKRYQQLISQNFGREYLSNFNFISSYPLVSGDTFKSLCDVFYNVNSDAQKIFNILVENINNDILLFIDTKSEYQKLLKLIRKNKFLKLKIIFTNGDKSLTKKEITELSKSSKKIFLINGHEILHNVINIPLGIDNFINVKYSQLEYYSHTSLENFGKFSKEYLTLANFDVNTNLKYRNYVLKLCSQFSDVKILRTKDLQENVKNMMKSYFIISPRGNGIDCYRTWESMYLNSIPVIEQVNALPYMKNLPILIVKKYSDFLSLSEKEKLELYYKFSSKKYSKLHFDYWYKLIKS